MPHLQIWLYTTRTEGCFAKRYDQFCQLLGLQQQRHPSRIKQQIGPSLDELREHGYIGSWVLSETRDGRGFKVELYHGAKFHRDLRLRQGQKLDDDLGLTLATEVADEGGGEPLVDLMTELTKRGITTKVAQQIIERAPDPSLVLDRLEWGDHLVGMNRDRFYNPAGFYVSLLRGERSRASWIRDESPPSRSGGGPSPTVEARGGDRPWLPHLILLQGAPAARENPR